jgi:hypothetical protein
VVIETLSHVMTGALAFGGCAICTLYDRGYKCLEMIEMIEALLQFLSWPCGSEIFQGGCSVSTGRRDISDCSRYFF